MAKGKNQSRVGWLGLFVITLAAIGCDSAKPIVLTADTLPKYKLKPGQELHYIGKVDGKIGDQVRKSSAETRFWVTRANPDGSWRIVARNATAEGSNPGAPAAHATVYYFDLYPDGHFTANPSFGFQANPSNYFADLPKSEAEAREGWKISDSSTDTDSAYMLVTKADASPNDVTFERSEVGPFNKVYGTKTSSELTFSLDNAVVNRITSVRSTPPHSSAHGTYELMKMSEREPVWIASLDKDSERYFETETRYNEIIAALPRDIANAEAHMKEAAQLWTALQNEVKNEIVAEAVVRRIAESSMSAQYALEDAKQIAAQLGKPAPAWDTTDLSGKLHKLSDYKGKVVLLDFWYRGCGWCIRAMPQINQVADDFAGQPVAVIGMNTDSNLEDALFVQSTMHLKYPSMRIKSDFPAEYGISGFPTLVIIDQEGVIRDMHVGYSATLREDMGKVIRGLLANKGSGAVGQ